MPSRIEPASFHELQLKELQDIERWLKAVPAVLGEDPKIVASQFSGFDKTSDRPDLLALDRVDDVYRAYEAKEHDRVLSAAEAREELDRFTGSGDLDEIDEEEQPRIILAAGNF